MLNVRITSVPVEHDIQHNYHQLTDFIFMQSTVWSNVALAIFPVTCILLFLCVLFTELHMLKLIKIHYLPL